MSTPGAARRVLVKAHRYVGLTLALFIMAIAATSSVVLFYGKLERAVNSQLRVVEPRNADWTLQQLLAIRERLEAQDPRSPVFSLPPVGWPHALALGQRYLAEQAKAQGLRVDRALALEYRRDLGIYFYLARTSRDLRDGDSPAETNSPATAATVAIDAVDGHFAGVLIPTGQRVSFPGQSAVSLIGILVVVITVTRILIWWRKQKSRSSRTSNVAAATPPPFKAVATEQAV